MLRQFAIRVGPDAPQVLLCMIRGWDALLAYARKSEGLKLHGSRPSVGEVLRGAAIGVQFMHRGIPADTDGECSEPVQFLHGDDLELTKQLGTDDTGEESEPLTGGEF